MKNRNLLFVLLTVSNLVLGQEIKFDQKLIKDLTAIGMEIPISKRTKLIKLQSMNEKAQVGRNISTGRRNISIAPNERVVSFTNDFAYKTRLGKNGATEFIKSENGVEIAHLDVDYQSEVQVIDENGNVVYCDLLDGSATSYSFFSPDLKLLKTYKPYEGGFNTTNYGFSSKLLCIYSQIDDKTDLYKLSLLNHEGDLIAEREFNRDHYLPASIKIVNDRILLLMSSTNSSASTVNAFDLALNKVWEKEMPKRIVNYQLISSDLTSSVLLNTQDAIACVNTSDGSQLWSFPVSQFNEISDGSKQIEADFFMNDQFVAINIGNFQSGSERVTRNVLTIMDRKSGRTVHIEKLGDSSKPVGILGGDAGLLVVKDSEFKLLNVQ